MKLISSFLKRRRLNLFKKNLAKMEEFYIINDEKGWVANAETCLYLTELIIPNIDLLDINILKDFTIKTIFSDTNQIRAWLDDYSRRLKYVEGFTYTKEQVQEFKETHDMNIFKFFYNSNGTVSTAHIKKWLFDLQRDLENIIAISENPKINSAKVSYLKRMSTPSITQITTVVESLAIGLANVELT